MAWVDAVTALGLFSECFPSFALYLLYQNTDILFCSVCLLVLLNRLSFLFIAVALWLLLVLLLLLFQNWDQVCVCGGGEETKCVLEQILYHCFHCQFSYFFFFLFLPIALFLACLLFCPLFISIFPLIISSYIINSVIVDSVMSFFYFLKFYKIHVD